MSSILVFGEVRDGSLKGITAELLAAAKELGGEASVVVVGNGIDAAAAAAAQHDGVTKVYAAQGGDLAAYSAQGYANAVKSAIEASGANVVLFGATAMGKELSARTAAKCSASLFADCTEVRMEDGKLVARRPVYSGKVYVEMESQSTVQMASLRPNTYAPVAATGGSGTVESLSVDTGTITAKVREFTSTAQGGKDLTEAEIVVSGGRSLKSEENFGIIKELADALGATVGASRAAVDAGYAPHSMQVGQTGKVVNPKLYFAVGISGAIQHLVGMRTSKVIVAINKDDSAPIFQKSDYGIVGDLFEVVPAVTREVKALLG